MLTRQDGQRLHLVLGTPWRHALGAYLVNQGETDETLWRPPDDYARGDLLLTVLDSKPRMLLCLERARRPSSQRSRNIHIEDEVNVFSPLVPLQVLAARLGRDVPSAPATLRDALADDLLRALQAEIASPTPWWEAEGKRSASTSRARSAGLQANALAASGGVCVACDRDFGRLLGGAGLAGLEVHHLDGLSRAEEEVVLTSPDRLVVLCGGCHCVVHGPASPTVEELRFAWRPRCPACDATVTRIILYGDTGAFLDARHFVAGGCLTGPDSPEWSCGACGHEWQEAL